MLLGAFDDAVGCVYIDATSGPSPDSVLSAAHFDHGTVGTQELVAHHQKRTAHRVGFVGMWHTHPYGQAYPSPTDEAGIGWIVSPDGAGRRALMLILGGTGERWNAWREQGDTPEIYLRVVDRHDAIQPAIRRAGSPVVLPTGSFPGGFYHPDPGSPPQSAWWRRLFGGKS
ncbi:Mov34/MPN/PAD-1 family protein [Mycobacterium sp.]|uniref:Mov34/MPN/PAD-1 family protein n=1 Tax=Mycobacterium sp. TaxID=1785 RepID=UPI00345B98BD